MININGKTNDDTFRNMGGSDGESCTGKALKNTAVSGVAGAVMGSLKAAWVGGPQYGDTWRPAFRQMTRTISAQ